MLRDSPQAEVVGRPPADASFEAAVLAGLSATPKTIPARYLYDRRGSALFEEITRLPEYYPTRTEIALLAAHAPSVRRLAGEGRVVVEFGSGSSTKTPLLLRAIAPAAYVPVDISADFLREAAARVGEAVDVPVEPVAADFTEPFDLPPGYEGRAKLGFFPGSTIGNMTAAAAVDLLRGFGRTLGPDSILLIGMDLKKDPWLLEAAYDDAAGVTAAFNRNLLVRINRELDGDIDVSSFEHRAVWNALQSRIEMHLLATRDMELHVAGQTFRMAEGETIHTENSHKYSLEEARLLARASRWEPVACWTDRDLLFSLHLWCRAPDRPEP